MVVYLLVFLLNKQAFTFCHFSGFFLVQIGVFLDLFIFIIIFFHVYDSMMSLSVYSLAACLM